MGLNHAQNVFFCHFLEFESLVFLEVEYSDSLQQCLTSSGGNIHKIIGKGANLGPKIGFFYLFPSSVHQFSLQSLEKSLTTSRGKTYQKNVGTRIRFFAIFSSLHQQFFLIVHRIAAWEQCQASSRAETAKKVDDI